MSYFEPENIPGSPDPINWKGIVLWVLGVLTTVSLMIGGVASSTLWGHDSRITTIETKMPAIDRRMDDHEARDARSWDRLDATMKRLEDKMDKLTDRVK